jgi:pimeloyl-ACP methyl ester carboxylesterase
MFFNPLTSRSTWNRLAIGWLSVVTSLLVALPALAQVGAPSTTQMIDAGGLKLRAQIDGPAREGQPTVVLVSAFGDSLETWKLVQPAVAQFARVVAYDRAGLGQSEADDAPPTPQRIANQLHALLQNAGIKPPYVLVGHSIGGPYVRMFAGLYPSEVAGLVYVDPSDFTQTRADQLAIWTELGAGEAGMIATEKAQWQQFAEAPPAVRAEAQVAEQLYKNGWADFISLPPVPDVPVVILMATKVDMPPEVKAVFGKQRIMHFAKWAVDVSDGMLVMTGRSGHYIQQSEPELVTWAIRRALKLDSGQPSR